MGDAHNAQIRIRVRRHQGDGGKPARGPRVDGCRHGIAGQVTAQPHGSHHHHHGGDQHGGDAESPESYLIHQIRCEGRTKHDTNHHQHQLAGCHRRL